MVQRQYAARRIKKPRYVWEDIARFDRENGRLIERLWSRFLISKTTKTSLQQSFLKNTKMLKNENRNWIGLLVKATCFLGLATILIHIIRLLRPKPHHGSFRIPSPQLSANARETLQLLLQESHRYPLSR